MKKIVSLVVLLSMVISTLPVYAEQSKEMENVLLSVKERIMNTDDFEDFNASVMDNEGIKKYSFDWMTQKEDEYRNLSVTSTESGIILNYRYNDYEMNSYRLTPSLNKISSDEAMKKAKELADKLNPQIMGEIRVIKTEENESLFDNTYSFNLQRYIDDVPVYNDSGFITLNQEADKIIRYSLNYSEGLEFDNKENIISVSDAWKCFYNNSGVELEYRTEYDNGEKKVKLYYIPQMKYDQYIDAKTGELMNIWQENELYFSEDMAMKEAAGTISNSRLSEAEIQKLKEVEGVLSVEDAKKSILNSEILDISLDLEFTSVNLYKEYNGDRYFYDLSFEKNDDGEYLYASATLDAKTLELIRWRARTKDYTNYKNSGQNVDEELIVEKAKEALNILANKYFQNGNGQYKINGDINENIQYLRYVNDIKYSDDYINIEINPLNGKVSSYSINYSDIDFPSPEGIISAEEAVEKLSKKIDNSLYYFKHKNDARLGYFLKDISSCEIDAFSGELKNYSIKEENSEYIDIEGHYAKKEIETLKRFGIGFEGEEFKPNEVITQNEYVTLLISTFSNFSPIMLRKENEITAQFKQARQNGIIKDNDGEPGDALTREKAAIYMIRVLGIEEYAKISSIYRPVFSDVTQNIGYISILAGLGVFNGDEQGLFNPQNKLIRADAAIIIYNYLNR